MELHYDKRAASYSISPQEKRELEKFTKFFILKTAQVIVQSRQGVKIATNSKPQTSTSDWFNISVPDCAHVTEATKKAFAGDTISSTCLPVCIEISLRTAEGDTMVLETWSLGLGQEPGEPSVKAVSAVYYRMGILLKSLISISRITPAYKLSRQQSNDTYVILYNVYTGDGNTECLGERYKEVKVGQLSTLMGTIFLKLCYRTTMTITPNNSQKSKESIMVKSDHFNTNLSSTSTIRKEKERKPVDLSKPLRAGAFVDMEQLKELHDKLSLQLPPQPSAWMLAEKEKLEKRKLEEEKQSSSSKDTTQPSPANGEAAAGGHAKSEAIDVPRTTRFSAEDQKLLKMLNCPFADGSPIMDLAQFYQDCIHAPQLGDGGGEGDSGGEGAESAHSSSSRSTEDDAAALSRQLLMFESSIPEFDSVIASMYSSSTD